MGRQVICFAELGQFGGVPSIPNGSPLGSPPRPQAWCPAAMPAAGAGSHQAGVLPPNLLRPCLQLVLPPAALRVVFPPWEPIYSPLEILDSPSKGRGSLFSPTRHLGSAWVTC